MYAHYSGVRPLVKWRPSCGCRQVCVKKKNLRYIKHTQKHTHTHTWEAMLESCDGSEFAVSSGPSRSLTDCFRDVAEGCWTTKLNPNYIWPEPLVHFNSFDVKHCVSLCFGFLYTSKPSALLTVHFLLSQKYSTGGGIRADNFFQRNIIRKCKYSRLASFDQYNTRQYITVHIYTHIYHN